MEKCPENMPGTSASDEYEDEDKNDEFPTGGNGGGAGVKAAAAAPPAGTSNAYHSAEVSTYVPSSADLLQKNASKENGQVKPAAADSIKAENKPPLTSKFSVATRATPRLRLAKMKVPKRRSCPSRRK